MDLNDKQMQAALAGWTQNAAFREVADAMMPRACAIQQTIPLLANHLVTDVPSTNEENSVLTPDEQTSAEY